MSVGLHRAHLRGLEDEDGSRRDPESSVRLPAGRHLRAVLSGVCENAEATVPLRPGRRDLPLVPNRGPHGVRFSTDPNFHFSFTQDLLYSGFLASGVGTDFALTYSFTHFRNVIVGYYIL